MSGRVGLVGAAIAAAALVLLVLHAAHDSSPLDFFASHWSASKFMSHVKCGCAMHPSGRCFQGDWQALLRNHSAVSQFAANSSSVVVAKHSVCAGTPAVVRGCLRTDLQRWGEQTKVLAAIPPTAEQRQVISSTFLDLLEDSMDGCDGEVCDVEEDEDEDEENEDSLGEEEIEELGDSYDELVDAADEMLHRPAPGPGGDLLPPPPTPPRDSPPQAGLRGSATTSKDGARGSSSGPHRLLKVAHKVLHRHADRYLRGVSEMAAVDRLLSIDGGEARQVYPIDEFVADFRDWQDGDEPVEMDISGSGWRRCLRSFLYALKKHWTCQIGKDLMNWSHGLRSVRLYTRNVMPDFEFDTMTKQGLGAGVFVMQPLGTTRWELAPTEGDQPLGLIVRAGDIVYIPRDWDANAECLTSRCVSMVVSP